MISARLSTEQQMQCSVVLDKGKVRIEDTEDRVLMVSLHVHFLTEQFQHQHDEHGVLQPVALEVGSALHFLAALRQLERKGYKVEISEESELENPVA